MIHHIDLAERDFFTLLRAGLWEKKSGELSEQPDWEQIYLMADEQKVQGLIAEGITVMDITSGIPDKIFKQFITDRGYILMMNMQVNAVQTKLCHALNTNGIPYAILKGQAVAQNYLKPEIRRSGDIDFLICEEDFDRTNSIFSAFTQETEYHNEEDLHHALFIDNVWVENHAMGKSYFTRRLDRILEKEKRRMFTESTFGHYDSDGCQISIPSPEYTALFLLGHILRHLTTEGISMKQLCDWARFLHDRHDAIDRSRLVQLIKDAGISDVWQKFSVFTVEWLGLEPNSLLMYESGHPEYGSAVWKAIEGSKKIRNESKKKHVGNFWLHYLKEYKIFLSKNNYLWKISKRAFVERIWDKFAPLPLEFLRRLFGFGGAKFHKNRFKE